MDSEEWEALGDLRNYQLKKSTSQSLLICECTATSLDDIQNFINANNLKSLDINQLKAHLGLGSGCSSCIKAKKDWKNLLSFR
jgi:bacterioferritin-associated ferredoxin